MSYKYTREHYTEWKKKKNRCSPAYRTHEMPAYISNRLDMSNTLVKNYAFINRKNKKDVTINSTGYIFYCPAKNNSLPRRAVMFCIDGEVINTSV